MNAGHVKPRARSRTSNLIAVNVGSRVGNGRTSVVVWLAAAIVLGLGLIGWTQVDYQLSGAIVVVPVLLIVALPLIRRAKAVEPDAWIQQLFLLALTAMFLAVLARYWVSFEFYGGRVDAAKYSRAAFDIAEQWREGVLLPSFDGPLIGNNFIIVATGGMFAAIGESILGAFMIWAWLGFWGLYFCFRAFQTAVPEGDHRRYAILIFFLPSILFWTGAVGKEAWMMFSIGLTLWGAARLLRHQRGALALLIAGMAATALVRPHITILLYGSLFIALMLRRSLANDRLGPLVKVALVLILIPVGFVVLDRAGSFLGVETFTPEAVGDLLDERTELTADIGNSTFAAVRVNDPLSALLAAVSVLFRPFPWEAGNLQLLLSSAEGVLLAVLAAFSLRRLVRLPRLLRDQPYVVLALIYLAGFIVAFSSLGNFGLLVRERIMALPLVFVLLALPRVRSRAGGAAPEDSTADGPADAGAIAAGPAPPRRRTPAPHPE